MYHSGSFNIRQFTCYIVIGIKPHHIYRKLNSLKSLQIKLEISAGKYSKLSFIKYVESCT